MISSDDAIFAWAIGKAVLIVVATFGALVYVVWWGITHQDKYDKPAWAYKDGTPERQAFRKSA